MRIAVLLLTAAVASTSVATQSAPRVATTLASAEFNRLKEVRKAVWVNGFPVTRWR